MPCTNYFDEIQHHGHAVAVVSDDGSQLTFAELANLADDFGAQLVKKTLVFLLVDNCADAVIGYLGCLRARRPAAMIASAISEAFLERLFAVYRPGYVWLPRSRVTEVANAKEIYSKGDYVLLCCEASGIEPYEHLALLMTTSGSTGSPKFVRQSYDNIAANTASISTYLGLRSTDRGITSLPLHYVFGLSILNTHFKAGATVILTGASLMEGRFWSTFRELRATSLSGVPYSFELLKRLRWNRMELPSLRMLTQAGGKLKSGLVNEFAVQCQEKGIEFYVMYGSAEATARMSYLPPHLARERSDSVGVAIPGGNFWIEDDQGKILTEADEVGELVYRGPNVTLGYAVCGEDIMLGDERAGILHTGDLARRDADGLYYIVGRISRFLKVMGNRVNLEELEHLLGNSGIECACAGEDDKLMVYVTDAEQSDSAIQCVQKITKLHPSTIKTVVIPSIPRNESGKIIYADLPK